MLDDDNTLPEPAETVLEEEELWVEGDDGTLVEGEVDNGGGGR